MDDVVVIGAGLAGLAAAKELVRAGKKVRVIEARDRVGGRTLGRATAHGHVLDLGAQWIGPTQDRIATLARELGVSTFAQHHDGKKVLAIGDRVRTYAKSIPSLPVIGLLDLHRTIQRVDALTGQVPLDAPWTAKRAAEWDALTVESWKRAHVHTRSARALVDIAVEAVFACEPSEISFLFFLFYLRSGGGLMRLTEIANGAQETRMIGGTQQIAIRMAAALGDRVTLSSPARAIAQTADGVIVRTDAGEHRARRAIVAVPPTLASRIEYEPALSSARDQLTQRMPMGSVGKCIAVYDTPFWRARGFSGEAVCDTGPVRLVFDDSPHGSRGPTQGALVAFMLGRSVREWGARDPEERKRAVLATLARFFGDEAAHPIEYFDHDWGAEAWTRGCYAGLMPPGVMTAYGHALAEPSGRIHWAGTETARVWNGYMEGALESGERAAREVIASAS